MMKRMQAKIYGRVQGVGFRAFVIDEASAMGLTGYARNLYFPKRYVEVVAEGEETDLEMLLAALRRGPAIARVEQVDVLWSEPARQYNGFGMAR